MNNIKPEELYNKFEKLPAKIKKKQIIVGITALKSKQSTPELPELNDLIT